MKKDYSLDHRACIAGTFLALGAIIALLGNTTAFAVDDEKKDSSGFVEKMKQWEDEMSRKFHDTFKNLWADSKEKPLTTASADLREQKDNYIVRLNLPYRNLEKVEVKLDGCTLHIVAPAENQAARYEQTITLAGVASDAPLVIDRREKENLIVITVPKSCAPAKAVPPTALPDPFNMPLSDWDREVFGRMEEMQRQMDQVFKDSFGEFQRFPQFKGFFDEPRFDSMFDLQTQGDNYVIRAYMPERDMDNVTVTVKDQTLKIAAKAESSANRKGQPQIMTQKADYSQIIMLPGPVNGDKMKIDKKEGMLVITLPKA